MDEKRRTDTFIGADTYWSKGPTTSGGTYSSLPVTAVKTTVSRGHAWPRPGTPSTDLGGDFSTIGIESLVTNDPARYFGAGFGYEYRGREFAIDPRTAINAALSRVAFSSDASLLVKGTTAIARCLPTNPVADAGTFIGELKSGLPKLVGRELLKSKFKDYRKVGSEYLNVEFGWKPLVSDLQKFGKAAIESEKIIEQLHRDSGKNIRRKFTFPVETTTSEGTVSNRLAATATGGSAYPYCYKSPGGAVLRTVVETETKTWFSGCFTYHVNLGNTLPDKLSRHAAEARKLFGVELTPETVWNLAPWSWAVDWEGNVGDVLHNVSRFSQDGLVMRYGYIMQEKTARIVYTLAGAGRLDTAPTRDLNLIVTSKSKIRRRATPFGFGFDMTALSGRQSAILGALGISRGPRHL